MTHCYRCNVDLPKGVVVTRRSVRVGSSSGVAWGKRMRVSSRSQYAERAFCQACITAMDTRPPFQLSGLGKVGLGLFGFFLLMGIVGSIGDKSRRTDTPRPSAIAAPTQPAPVTDMATPKKPRRKKKPAARAESPQPPASVSDDEILSPY